MPRVRRTACAAPYYHVVNRGVHRRQLFFDPDDYQAFLTILDECPRRSLVNFLAYCLMPNHWHFVVAPSSGSALSAYMQWVTSTHARRWNRYRGLEGQGHVYQDRFGGFPIENEHHLIAVLRYVEANPVRAGLVADGSQWRWSSATEDKASRLDLAPWPLPKPSNWLALLNQPLDTSHLDAIRLSVRCGRELDQPPRRGRPRKGSRGVPLLSP